MYLKLLLSSSSSSHERSVCFFFSRSQKYLFVLLVWNLFVFYPDFLLFASRTRDFPPQVPKFSLYLSAGFCTVPYNNFTRIVCATQSSRSPHSISEHTFASQSINSLHTYVCVDRYLFAHRSLKRFFSRLDYYRFLEQRFNESRIFTRKKRR